MFRNSASRASGLSAVVALRWASSPEIPSAVSIAAGLPSAISAVIRRRQLLSVTATPYKRTRPTVAVVLPKRERRTQAASRDPCHAPRTERALRRETRERADDGRGPP